MVRHPVKQIQTQIPPQSHICLDALLKVRKEYALRAKDPEVQAAADARGQRLNAMITRMKEEGGMSSRCMPLKQECLDDKCAICGKPAKHSIYWGIAY